MTQAASNPETVQFSRTQGILSAIALGGSVVLGTGLFIAGPQLAVQSGNDMPLAYCVSAVLFLFFILSCVQRSSGLPSNAGLLAAARFSGSAPRVFFSVWLMLGGYVALGALLAYATGMRINLGLERLFGLSVGTEIITLLLVALAFFKEVLTRAENWRSRTVIFWTCMIVLLSMVIWGYLGHLRTGVKLPKTESMQHWLLTASILASNLWGIDIVLNYRGQYYRPNRTSLWSLIAILCGGNLLGALVAVEILRNPSLLMQNWLTGLTWNEHRLELVILIAGILVCGSGLLRVMTRMFRILGFLMMQGGLPSSNQAGEEPGSTIYYYAGILCAFLAYCAVSFSVMYLLLISGFTALLTLALYISSLLKKEVWRATRLRLPLHPLIPVSAIVIAIFLMWIMPVQDLFAGGVWLLAGTALYWGYARKRLLPAMRKEQVVVAEGSTLSADYRVLVCLSDPEINESLMRIGSAVAAANSGDLLVLRILETSELLPVDVQHDLGNAEWNRIQGALQGIQLPGQTILPVVRMAPDLISGIKATLSEFAFDFILVEWPKETAEKLRKNQLQSLFDLTAKPLGIFKGRIGVTGPRNLSVACGSSSHAIEAMQIGEAIAKANKSSLGVLRVFPKSQSEETAKDAVQKTILESGIHVPPEVSFREDADIESGILQMADLSDLLLLGASDDPLSGRPLPDGKSIDIALQRHPATLIIKSKEEQGSFLMRSAMGHVTKRVQALTPKERSELLGQLKVGLQARTDFYLMVALAAAIAITGLIMNDGSIVLGAMLVSPLMSPIVGIACGIALGNLDLIRRSGASTSKGMALVLGVGVVMTFLLPGVEPTDQILSRTHPGIFDLLAALAAGAAGAYSLGRKTVAGALPGVAMSLSLEPPLATAGYGLSTSQFWITGGALLLFFTNLAAIVLSGASVYLLLGMRPPRKEGLSLVGKAVASVILATLILVIPLGLGTYGSIQKGHLKFQIESEFRSEALRERFELLELKITEQDTGFLIHPTVLAFEPVTPAKIEAFRKIIEKKVGSPIQIDATILQTQRIESPPSKQ